MKTMRYLQYQLTIPLWLFLTALPSLSLTAQYTYDSNGNLTKDPFRGIDSIFYNDLNLVDSVIFSNEGKLYYTYDANGVKLAATIIHANGETTVHYYFDGIEYDQSGNIAGKQLQFLATGEGRAIPQGTAFTYEYYVKDHLGNTRIGFDQEPGNGPARIMQTDHYYPFGSSQPGNGYTNGIPNRYRYNGKEFQDELDLNLYNYGTRMYDPVLGRWNSNDPLAAKFHSLSSYAYVANNPVNVIDPDGREGVRPSERGGWNDAGGSLLQNVEAAELAAKRKEIGKAALPILAPFLPELAINKLLDSKLLIGMPGMFSMGQELGGSLEKTGGVFINMGSTDLLRVLPFCSFSIQDGANCSVKLEWAGKNGRINYRTSFAANILLADNLLGPGIGMDVESNQTLMNGALPPLRRREEVNAANVGAGFAGVYLSGGLQENIKNGLQHRYFRGATGFGYEGNLLVGGLPVPFMALRGGPLVHLLVPIYENRPVEEQVK